ncbi:MAG: GNAT family N-acetyltransferase [Ktedonobacterales bacterium]
MDVQGERRLPGAAGGSWYTWWRGDVLPELPPLPGFRAEAMMEPARAAALTHLDEVAARERSAHGHRLYVAFVGDTPTGWGWSAARTASIGELGLALHMPPGNRYLWSFETAPVWRGRGIYPRLLQHILRHEAPDAQRVWIGHEPGNIPSARGIRKAGFAYLGEIALLPDGALLLVPECPNAERVRAGAAILGAGVASGV